MKLLRRVLKHLKKLLNERRNEERMKHLDVDAELIDELAQSLKHIIETHKQPMIRIHPSDEEPSLFASKFGGIPYIPKDADAPTDDSGRTLTLLAQINIEELPENNIYPMKTGILQFWILNESVLGLYEEGGHKVLYYPEIDRSVTLEDIQAKYKPYAGDEHAIFPVGGVFSLHFDLGEDYVTIADYRFERLLDGALKAFFQTHKEKIMEFLQSNKTKYGEYIEYYDSLDVVSMINLLGLFDDLVGSEEYKHKIGGYADCIQDDPRMGNDGESDYEITLLQMISDRTNEQEIMFGDDGIANFFIKAEDLKKLNFDNVLYNWDC